MEYYIKDGELYHHGTKGMKWGRRRYQNPDGSLTPLGRLRYGAGKAGEGVKKAVKGAVEKHKTKRANEKESERIEKLMKKPINKLTDAELAERTARAQKQKNLRDIESQSNRLANDGQAFAKKFGSKMLNEAIVPAAINAGRGTVEKLLSKKLSEVLGLSEKDTNEVLKKSVETLRLTKEKGDLEKALSGKDSTKEADAKLAEEATRASNQVKLETAKRTLKKYADEDAAKQAEEEEKKKKKD